MNDYYLNKDKHLYKETLIDDLQKYENLKLAIKNLQKTEEDLNSKNQTQGKQTNKKRIRYSEENQEKKSVNG